MIIVKLMGGLGNQMFEYAAARSLANMKHVDLKLDLGWFDIKQVDTLRPYELKDLNTTKHSISATDFKLLDDNKVSRLKLRLSKNSNSLINYTEQYFQFNRRVLSLPDYSYLDGYFQSEKYFHNIRDLLLSEFTPSYKLSKKVQQDLSWINKTKNSVSIHIRRGDYVNNVNAASFHGTSPLDYYYKALREIQAKIKGNLTVFVFSDDQTWCKNNLKLDYETHFINSATRSFDDMWLMSHCNHNVIANSSYSWWGAWLNKNPEKVVIAPKDWFTDKSIDTKDLIPSTWQRI